MPPWVWLVNVLFPPAVQTKYAGRAVEKFAEEIGSLLDSAATAMSAGAVTEEQATRWLEDARRLNRHAPRVDHALAHAEESRRLQSAGHRHPSGRAGAARGPRRARAQLGVDADPVPRDLFDATRQRTGVSEHPDYADDVRRCAAGLMLQMGRVVRAFGELLRRELETSGEHEQRQVVESLDGLRTARSQVEDLLLADSRSRHGLWELNSALLTTADRMLTELDVAAHSRLRPGPDESSSRRRARQVAGRFRATTRRRVHRTATDPSTGAPDR